MPFAAVVRLSPRGDFSIPADPQTDGGFDLVPIAAFFVDTDSDDAVIEQPWETWTLEVLDWARNEIGDGPESDLVGVLFCANVEDDLGHWHDEDAADGVGGATEGLPTFFKETEDVIRAAVVAGRRVKPSELPGYGEAPQGWNW